MSWNIRRARRPRACPERSRRVDYFQGPPTFHQETGRWRRPCLDGIGADDPSPAPATAMKNSYGGRTAPSSCGPTSTPSNPLLEFQLPFATTI
jgi:hypothetical protein